MRFKMNKELILTAVRNRAFYTVQGRLSNSSIESIDDLKTCITQCIADAVCDGIDEFIEMSYTDEDFEHDIGLTS
jgi:hypothetical protein